MLYFYLNIEYFLYLRQQKYFLGQLRIFIRAYPKIIGVKMRENIFFLCIVFFLLNASYAISEIKHKGINNKIKIVCTAAILENNHKERMAEYIKSMKIISQFGYEPYIIEACKSGPTFLDEYSNFVYYPNVNNPSLGKGFNEALSMLKGCEYFEFDDDDWIIKLTGRYYFADDYFVRLVEDNTDADAIVRTWSKEVPGQKGSIFTGCFAMKYKYLKEMLIGYLREKIDMIEKNDKRIYIIECFAAKYIYDLARNRAKVMFVKNLHVFANIKKIYNPDKPLYF